MPPVLNYRANHRVLISSSAVPVLSGPLLTIQASAQRVFPFDQ